MKTKTKKKSPNKVLTLRDIVNEVKGRNPAIMFDHFVDGRRSHHPYTCARWIQHSLHVKEDASGRSFMLIGDDLDSRLRFPLDTQIHLSEDGTRVKWDEVCGGALVRSNELVFYSYNPIKIPPKLKTISEVVMHAQKDDKAIALFHDVNRGEELRDFTHASGVRITSGSYSVGQSTLLEGKPVVSIWLCSDRLGRGITKEWQIPMGAVVRHSSITFVAAKEGSCVQWDDTMGGEVVRTHRLCFFSSSPMKVGT